MEVLRLIKSRVAHSCLLWIKGLLAAFIGGGASAGSSWMAMITAKASGVDVPVLNFKALGIIFLFSGIFNTLMYLKRSPVPQDCERDEDEWKGVIS